MASRVYRELTGEQKRRVRGLFKKMTGVAKIALKWGKSEGQAEGAVRLYLVEMGVVTLAREEKPGDICEEKVIIKKEDGFRRREMRKKVTTLFAMVYQRSMNENDRRKWLPDEMIASVYGRQVRGSGW